MKNVMSMIYAALKADTTLITLLGGIFASKGWNRIYNGQLAPNADEYPRMTMYEVMNDDAEPADDEPQESDVIARVDLWAKTDNTFAITKQAKKTIKSIFDTCTISIRYIGYDDETGSYHKQLEMRILIEQEN